MDCFCDFSVALYHGGIPHVVTGAVHMGHPAILIREIQIALRMIAHGNGNGGGAIPGHVGIKLSCLLQRKALKCTF